MIKLNILKYAHGSIGPKKWLNSFWRKLWLSINYKVSVKWKRYIDQKPKKKKQIQITIFIWLSGYFLLMKYFFRHRTRFFSIEHFNLFKCARGMTVKQSWAKKQFFLETSCQPVKISIHRAVIYAFVRYFFRFLFD